MLESIRIVMIETTHAGNIGAAARAMKNMGLQRLYLVKPRSFPHEEASARASGADDILQNAVVCQSLDEALVGCRQVFGASARSERSLPWPIITARDCGEQIMARFAGQEVALVFGRESSGLTNEELERCHQLLHIPCDPGFSSLNVAAAIQVVSYELRTACLQQQQVGSEAVESGGGDVLISAEELERLYQHLEQTMVQVGFLDPDNPRHLMRRMRRLFQRARVEQTEYNILRGILSAIQKYQP